MDVLKNNVVYVNILVHVVNEDFRMSFNNLKANFLNIELIKKFNLKIF